jgi:hypothetical protein
MTKPYVFAIAGSAALVLALASSAQAAGGHGRTSGQAFTPPGFSKNTTGQSHGNWTNGQPPGWSRNSTGQINGWGNASGTGGVPPGLGSPPGRR